MTFRSITARSIDRTSRPRGSRGFTLTEAAVLAAGVALAGALLAPTLGSMRTDARLAGSRDNLRQLGAAHAAYSEANEGFIATFDWEGRSPNKIGDPGRSFELGCGVISQPIDNLEASQLQLAALLRKATGRCGPGVPPSENIIPNRSWLPHRRFGHIPLLDWLGASPTDPIAVSPLDVNQIAFQERTKAGQFFDLPGGDDDSSYGVFRDLASVKLWPYASSYQTTTYAYSDSRPSGPNDTLGIIPSSDATQFFVADPSSIRPQLRQFVRFPSNKALLFEEFDYSQGLGNQGRYYADPLASVNILAFDGSARRVATADANPGWDPEHFRDMDATTELRYRSIDTRYFPDDSERPDPYPGYYKWTRGGLEGIDFGAGEINTSEW